jgi:ABC-type uncharacterized transport system substrate-binding protein
MTATSPASVVSVRESETAARAIGIKLVIFNASSDAEIEAAFAKIVQARLGALLVGADPLRHNASACRRQHSRSARTRQS